MSGFLPAGRKLQVGVYWGMLYDGFPAPQEGTAANDYDLTHLALTSPGIGGATAYPMQTNPNGVFARPGII